MFFKALSRKKLLLLFPFNGKNIVTKNSHKNQISSYLENNYLAGYYRST